MTDRSPNRVLATVLEELSGSGLTQFSFDDVAGRTGVSADSLRARYGDEENLIIAALGRHARERIVIPDTGSLLKDLESLSLSVAENLNCEPGRRLLRSLVASDARNTSIVQAFWQQRMTDLSIVAERAASREELRDGVTPEQTVEALLSPIYVRALYTNEPIDEEFCLLVAELAWRAVGKP